VSVAAGIVAAVALMGPLGHAGLAAAASVGAYVNVLTLMVAARRRLGPLGGRAIVASAVRTVLACIPVAAWCVALLAFRPVAEGTRGDLALVALGVGGGAVLFWVATALLHAPERAALAAILPRRRRA
jgi:putative peptidoglycan lipid II flippase